MFENKVLIMIFGAKREKIAENLFNRCGIGGGNRACHAAGSGSLPGRDKFPG